MKLLWLLLAPAALARADLRTSADYAIAADTLDAGGHRASSADYTADQAIGEEAAGSGSSVAPPSLARQGYTGQLLDPAGLSTDLATNPLPESASTQLSALVICDDGSFQPLGAGEITWNVISGPVDPVSAQGVVTAQRVYADTPVVIHPAWKGLTHSLEFTVLDTDPDNYQGYAGDGIDDGWQVGFFGLGNPNAAATADPDGDGDSNLFEFNAGLIPTDWASRFDFAFDQPTSIPGRATVRFGPLRPGRTYTVLWTIDLETWEKLDPALSSTHDDGDHRRVTDEVAPGPRRLYRVLVEKP